MADFAVVLVIVPTTMFAIHQRAALINRQFLKLNMILAWLDYNTRTEVVVVVLISGKQSSVQIVGKDITEKTVSNLALIGDLVNFALEDATAVEMKYVIERLVALLAMLRNQRVFQENQVNQRTGKQLLV